MAKCTMCVDRVSEGMLPACVKTCPTGAMQFGDRGTIRKMAEERLDEVRKIYGRASLVVPEAVRVIFLLKDYPEKYYEYAATEDVRGITRKTALKQLLHPFAAVEEWIG
jgi:formate dehydrogenase iron-sulfur subunit